jgi:hypothetical protein
VWRQGKARGRKEDSSFCEQKEAKKLYPFEAGSTGSTAPCEKSFFASFFSKKEDSFFLPLAFFTASARTEQTTGDPA